MQAPQVTGRRVPGGQRNSVGVVVDLLNPVVKTPSSVKDSRLGRGLQESLDPLRLVGGNLQFDRPRFFAGGESGGVGTVGNDQRLHCTGGYRRTDELPGTFDWDG